MLFALVAIAAVVGVITGIGLDDTTPVASGHPSAKPTVDHDGDRDRDGHRHRDDVRGRDRDDERDRRARRATAEPDPTTTAPVDSTHRPHTRPRPTYDPMGI